MSDQWTDRLSEYLDGDLSEAERSELQTHLVGCVECGEIVERLRRVVARAEALDDRPPSRALWSGIVAQIRTDDRGERAVPKSTRSTVGRRISFTVPQLMAAGIALIFVTSVAVLLLQPPPSSLQTAELAEPVPSVLVGFNSSEYDATIAELRAELQANRDKLGPETIEIIEQSLTAIDNAIQDARLALERDPSNSYVSAHLAATMKRKVQLLQRVAAIAAAAD